MGDKILNVRQSEGERRNIVAHIFIDEGPMFSYSRMIIDWPRVILAPLYLLGEILEPEIFHFMRNEIVTNFAGYIVRIEQCGEESFVVVWYDSPSFRSARRVWRNILRSGWKIFPNYVKEPEFSCWCTEEGDAVEYIPLSKMGSVPDRLSRGEFFALTGQSDEGFRCSEYIKYTGM